MRSTTAKTPGAVDAAIRMQCVPGNLLCVGRVLKHRLVRRLAAMLIHLKQHSQRPVETGNAHLIL